MNKDPAFIGTLIAAVLIALVLGIFASVMVLTYTPPQPTGFVSFADLGRTPQLVAKQYIFDASRSNGVTVTSVDCVQNELNVNTVASVTCSGDSDQGKYKVTIHMVKSLWQVTAGQAG